MNSLPNGIKYNLNVMFEPKKPSWFHPLGKSLFDQAVACTDSTRRDALAEDIAKKYINDWSSTQPLVNMIVAKALDPYYCTGNGHGSMWLGALLSALLSAFGVEQRSELQAHLAETLMQTTTRNGSQRPCKRCDKWISQDVKTSPSPGSQVKLKHQTRGTLMFGMFSGEIFSRDIIDRATLIKIVEITLERPVCVDQLAAALCILHHGGSKIWSCITTYGGSLEPKLVAVDELKRLVSDTGQVTQRQRYNRCYGVGTHVLASAPAVGMTPGQMMVKHILPRVFEMVNRHACVAGTRIEGGTELYLSTL